VNKVIAGILAGVVLGGAAAWILLRPSPSAEKAEPEEGAATESFVHTDANGVVQIKLDQDTQARMGLKVSPLAAAQVQPEAKAFGRVLDPAPLAERMAERAAAQAGLDASTKELDRLRTLAQGQNASARAIESAEAAVRRDEAAVDTAKARLLMGWGRALASRPDMPGLVHSLVNEEAALIRVDLPLGESLNDLPSRARVASLAHPDSPLEAEVLGPAPVVDPQMQGQGFILLYKSRALQPGAAVKAWLATSGQVESGVAVPRDALLRHEAEVFVYVQVGEENFVRRQVKLDRPLDAGWFVREGLKAQDRVVVVGAQQLLSEELKGQMGGE
jgi:hypothetical protein